MNKIVIYIIGCFLLAPVNVLFSQVAQPVQLIYLPQGHVIERLSGGGNLGATLASKTNITSVNPAAICDILGFTAGIIYQINSSIPDAWPTTIGFERNYKYYPQSINLSFKWNDLTLGIGSNQIYNGTVDYGNIKMTAVADNDLGYTILGTIHPKRKDMVLKNSLVCNYNFKNLWQLPSNLSIGIRYNYNILQTQFEIKGNVDPSVYKFSPTSWDEKIYAFNFAIGIKYSLNTEKLKIFSLGIFYESQLDFDKYVISNTDKLRYYGFIPAKFHTGGRIGFYNGFMFSANLSYYLWELLNETNSLNQIEINSDLSYSLSSNLVATLGLLITDRQYNFIEDEFKTNESLFATFLTIGFIYQYKNYEFDFSFADSHFISDDWRKQSILKFGIGYSLK